MLAYWFRFLDDDGIPTGYMGMVAAKDKIDLFWAIDEFGDPLNCEIATVKRAGVSFFYQRNSDNDVDVPTEFKASEELDYTHHRHWKKPEWDLVACYDRKI